MFKCIIILDLDLIILTSLLVIFSSLTSDSFVDIAHTQIETEQNLAYDGEDITYSSDLDESDQEQSDSYYKQPLT